MNVRHNAKALLRAGLVVLVVAGTCQGLVEKFHPAPAPAVVKVGGNPSDVINRGAGVPYCVVTPDAAAC